MPHRGKRNDSRYVSLVAEKLSQLLERSPQELARISWDNGCRLFGIRQP